MIDFEVQCYAGGRWADPMRKRMRTLFGHWMAWFTLAQILPAIMCDPGFAQVSQFDGPAELPRILLKSSVADTPTSGNVRLVKEGESLQQSIDESKCGDTLK